MLCILYYVDDHNLIVFLTCALCLLFFFCACSCLFNPCPFQLFLVGHSLPASLLAVHILYWFLSSCHAHMKLPQPPVPCLLLAVPLFSAPSILSSTSYPMGCLDVEGEALHHCGLLVCSGFHVFPTFCLLNFFTFTFVNMEASSHFFLLLALNGACAVQSFC